MELPNIAAEDFLCDESFQRYCTGENKSDVQHWEAWIREHPDKLPVVTAAKRLHEMLSLGQGNRLEQLAALKDAVARRSQFTEQVLNSQEAAYTAPARVIKFRSNTLLKYVASIILIGSIGILAYMKYGKPADDPHRNYEYYTGLHDRKTIMLPDSSIVMLNENSHLSVSRDFDGQHRQVAITGEAFFDIKHDTAFPFLVSTPQYTIRVLGTTFNVRSYPGIDTTETTLLTGKIEILERADGHTVPKVVLKPNQKFILATGAGDNKPQLAVSLSKGEVIKPGIDTSTRHLSETSWARRKMEINNKTLGEIAEQLQSWYGINIRFADETVKNLRYTATFDDETIFNALRYLQQSYPFSWTIDDDCIVIAKS